MKGLLFLLASLTSIACIGDSSKTAYHIDQRCQLIIQDTSAIDGLFEERIIYGFPNKVRTLMYQRRITFHKPNKNPINLICRVDMSGNVYQAWTEEPPYIGISKETQHGSIELAGNRLPNLGKFTYVHEDFGFSPCGSRSPGYPRADLTVQLPVAIKITPTQLPKIRFEFEES